jgi:hypothetical protein
VFRAVCSWRFVGYSETIPSTDDPNLRLSFRKTGISVNSTKALPCIDFFECACGHLGRSVDPVASLLVKSGFCRIRFWYAVGPGSGISRETSRNYFWNLTVEAAAIERAVQRLQPVAAPIGHLGPGILTHYRSPLSKWVADSYAACSRLASRTWRSCSPTVCFGT